MKFENRGVKNIKTVLIKLSSNTIKNTTKFSYLKNKFSNIAHFFNF